jgi:uncharacterized membrane protein
MLGIVNVFPAYLPRLRGYLNSDKTFFIRQYLKDLSEFLLAYLIKTFHYGIFCILILAAKYYFLSYTFIILL